MELPTYAVVCFVLSYLVLLIGGNAGKGTKAIAITLLLFAGGPTVYRAMSSDLAGESVPNMVLR